MTVLRRLAGLLRRLRGRGAALRLGPAAARSASFAVGAFSVAWDAEGRRLLVTHADRPDHTVWATIPGEGFVAAARGAERVSESRGHLSIRDRLRDICAEQHIERITAADGALTVAGRLVAAGGRAEVAYALTFRADGPRRLGFRLALGDPAFNRAYLSYASDPAERFFGFGAQYSRFDLKGRRVPIVVQEQGIGRGAQPITLAANLAAGAGGAWNTSYACVPHYVTSRLRSLFLTTYEYAAFDLRRPDRVRVELWAAELAGAILYGASPAELIAEYTAYAGRMRPLPEWAGAGVVVGIQGGTAAVRRTLALLDAHAVPVAAVWLQDWVGQRRTSFGAQLWWSWELDRARYPAWDELRDELRARGIRLLTYVNPYVVDTSAAPGRRRNLLREATEGGFLVRDGTGAPLLSRITDFSASLVDLTSPAARAWLKAVIRDEVLGAGADGWMADFGEGLPYQAHLASGEPAPRAHNRYPEAWARLNREVVEESGRGDELLFFMRAGYRESPRHATLFWLGDQLVSWDAHDGIKTAVTGLLSSGMSGFSLSHSDTGGYTAIDRPPLRYRRSKELLLRWMELSAFTCVFRTHEGNLPELNAQVTADEETLAHLSRCARIYRAWRPYRRQLIVEAAATGLPVVRHPFIEFPDDPQVYAITYEQFLVGAELLVAPVLDAGATAVSAYLPPGRWVHLWSGEAYESPRGRRVTVAAPLGEPGVFYRDGSAIAAAFIAELRALGVPAAASAGGAPMVPAHPPPNVAAPAPREDPRCRRCSGPDSAV